MSTIMVALSKNESGNPYTRGNARMTELAIEQWFGRLRIQSASASLSSRGYWQAAARETLRTFKAARVREDDKAPPPEQKQLPLSDEEFKACSERAMEAALALVAHTSAVTVASLRDMYNEWCESGRLNDPYTAVSPDEVDLEEEEEEDPEAELEKLDDCQRVLREIEESMGELGAPDEDNGERHRSTMIDLDLRNVPDKEQLLNLVAHEPTSPMKPFAKGTESPDFDPTSVPKTLRDAVFQDPDALKASNIWDRLWRLLMYQRYWCGGGDRLWVNNPRSCRRASSGLSWYQSLV